MPCYDISAFIPYVFHVLFTYRIEAPPSVSAAHEKYQQDRFRVQPGPIQNYGLGKGALAEQERKKVRTLQNLDFVWRIYLVND